MFSLLHPFRRRSFIFIHRFSPTEFFSANNNENLSVSRSTARSLSFALLYFSVSVSLALFLCLFVSNSRVSLRCSSTVSDNNVIEGLWWMCELCQVNCVCVLLPFVDCPLCPVNISWSCSWWVRVLLFGMFYVCFVISFLCSIVISPWLWCTDDVVVIMFLFL